MAVGHTTSRRLAWRIRGQARSYGIGVVTPPENNPHPVAVRLAGDGDLENADADAGKPDCYGLHAWQSPRINHDSCPLPSPLRY